MERNVDKMLALRVRWRESENERVGERERERDRPVSYFNPSPFTESLYEAWSLPVLTLKLQIPPRFADRTAELQGQGKPSFTCTRSHTRVHGKAHPIQHSYLSRTQGERNEEPLL